VAGYKTLPSKVFDTLETFILENAEKGNEATDLMGVSVRKNVGRVITAKNYVGVIALNDGNIIEILPKICGEDNETEVKKLLIKMLRTVQNSPFKSMQSTNVNVDKLPIFEIFIRMFIAETFAVVKRGLKSGYETVDDNLPVCKGKINFNNQIKYNLVHKEKFCVSYDEFNTNRPENRLVKSTLKYLFKYSTSSKNKTDLKTLLNVFENIGESANVDADFAKCVSDRNSKYYETLLIWCKVFLKGKSFTSFSGSEVAYALLFPMETVFENFVAKQLKKQLNSNEYSVSAQHSAKYLFDMPRKFSLRPDIVITRKSDGAIFIMDTKWKQLNSNPSSNYGISQSDMYQMYAYQKKYGSNAKNVTLLYPLTENAPQQEIKFVSDDGVTVNVVFVDLKTIETLSQDLHEKVIGSVNG
jgi:5-methylcytosine-specific restriction enzyme subunit McrC